jgi:hypothetical protein
MMQESVIAMKADIHSDKQPKLWIFSAEWRISGCIIQISENGFF